MLEKVLEIGLLYDFYGQLLTDKQRDIIDLYYNDDLSLGEISETMNVSRQGVYDILKRSEKMLYYYEDKLGLVKKFMEHKSRLKEVYFLLDSIADVDNEKVSIVKNMLYEIIESDI